MSSLAAVFWVFSLAEAFEGLPLNVPLSRALAQSHQHPAHYLPSPESEWALSSKGETMLSSKQASTPECGVCRRTPETTRLSEGTAKKPLGTRNHSLHKSDQAFHSAPS